MQVHGWITEWVYREKTIQSHYMKTLLVGKLSQSDYKEMQNNHKVTQNE